MHLENAKLCTILLAHRVLSQPITKVPHQGKRYISNLDMPAAVDSYSYTDCTPVAVDTGY